MDLEDIREHWRQAGDSFPTEGDVTPTSRDPFLGQLERQNVLSFLEPSFDALEIGCGDASHSIEYAQGVRSLSGLDLTASLLDLARARAAAAGVENLELSQGSVLDIGKLYQPRRFDCIISQRCLINLPEWRHQRDALAQARDLLKPGGLLLLTEGFQDALEQLNAARAALDLPEITVSYNRNMLREELEDFASRDFEIVERRHYGAYLVLSRTLHPLAVHPESPRHDSPLNEAAMKLSQAVPMPDLERYSYNLFYALRKKGLPNGLS